MGWCNEHLRACIFEDERSLQPEHCPEQNGEECTLVHIMLAVHRMPEPVRRKLIAALYPAYGIEAAPAPTKPPETTPEH